MSNLVDKHVPLIKYTNKDSELKTKPWINHRIHKMIKVRNRLRRKMKKNINEANAHSYKQFRNRVVNE